MKKSLVPGVLILCSLGTVSFFAGFRSSAADNASPPPVSVNAPARLPYGVEEVLKLTRAQVSEDTIVNFVQNSGTAYNLSANNILQLRQEGVTDRVITAMLEQRKKFVDSLAQTQAAQSPASPQPAPVYQSQATQAADPAPQTQPAPVYTQPAAPAPASSVYVIPYPAASSAYYGYYRPYPYYSYPYYPYYGPGISLGFAFGGGGYRYHGGGWGHYHHHH